MRKKAIQDLATLALGTGLLLFACEVDHGLGPIRSKIRGRVIFVDKLPPNTDQVQVAVAKTFPPKALLDLGLSGPLPFWQDTVEYEILLPLGHYEAVGVLWKEKGRTWSISSILGLYTRRNSLLPQAIDLTSEHPVKDSVDIYADPALIMRGAFLAGRITYVGQWLPDIQIIVLAAFPVIPEVQVDYLTARGMDLTRPVGVQYDDFLLDVTPDTLKYIAVFSISQVAGELKFRELGVYEDPLHPGEPGKVYVAKGDTARGINIWVDFGKVQP
jgi:hypothetical protein